VGCQKSNIAKNDSLKIGYIDSILFNYMLSTVKSKAIEKRIEFIDKAYHISLSASNDSLILKSLTYKSQLHSIGNQLDSAIIYSRKMLDISQILTDSTSIGKAYYKLGFYYNKKMIRDSSFHYYNESKKIYLLINDSVNVGKDLINMAIILSDIGDYTQSDATAIEALSYLEKSESSMYKASIYNCLAISARKQEDYEEALYWYEMAISTTKNRKNKLTYLNNIANIFIDKGKFKMAIAIFDSLIQDSLISKEILSKARVLDNSTYAKWLLTGNTQLIDGFEEALNIRIEQNDIYDQIASNSHLSEFYEEIDLMKSRRSAERMLELATELNTVDDRLEALAKLMNLYKDDLLAYKHYSKKYINLKDSITETRRVAKNQFAKIRYDSEKNRAENADLKIKSVQRQLELEKMKRQKIMSISFGLLFLMAFIFIYFQIKAKHKKDNLKQVYKTEARISKKVHDEVANDMYHVMTKLQNDGSDNHAVLDDLEKIYIKTRDISKENSSIDLNIDFGSVLNDLLLDYKNENVQIITRNLSKINWKNVSDRRKIGIYRVLQELMTNMKKHSGASLVVLSFSKMKKNIAIEYKDDGIGCKIKKNTGLQNAESRINTLNGSIKFESEINQGFRAKIIV